jgi:hypothetical protein
MNMSWSHIARCSRSEGKKEAASIRVFLQREDNNKNTKTIFSGEGDDSLFILVLLLRLGIQPQRQARD